MIEYQIHRENSEHTIAVNCITPDGEKVSLELATEIAETLSGKWACTLTLHRVDDMAWHARDYDVQIAAYDHGKLVT